MRVEQAVREVRKWTERFDYIGNVEVGHSQVVRGRYVKFQAYTTKTRASSIVTRIRLIVAEIAKDRPFEVVKQLEGDPPRDRQSLARWSIITFFPTKGAAEAARA